MVAEVLAASVVRGHDSFRKHLTHLGYFYVWARDHDVPLTVATLTRSNIEEYARTGMPGSSAKSRADRRSRLRRLADQHHPEQAPAPHVEIARPTVRPPYTDREVQALLRTAWNQPSAERTRKAALCIGLGLGAGLDSSDFRGLRRHHIQVTPDSSRPLVTVTVAETAARTAATTAARFVPVRVEYVELVLRGLEGLGSDQLLLGRVEERRNLAANALADVVVLGGCPRIEQSRLRATWLATLLMQPVRLDLLMTAAGLRTARTLPDLIPYLPPPTQEETGLALRGGPPAAAARAEVAA
ncbi:hypothetical protein [Nocardioides halotolerans]|uniref:hypothetical protein n=1 Tax=Nocardioides halotolerans TaxID=433660 RepID=UPI0012FC419D|nr:hypothetical protein [Nocardioides halotolerans]